MDYKQLSKRRTRKIEIKMSDRTGISPYSDSIRDTGRPRDGEAANFEKSLIVTKRSVNLYSRIVGKKNGASTEQNSTPPVSVKDKIINFFARESAEERTIRSNLKFYRNKLQAEVQNVGKANARHRKRVVEQIQEFKKQEKQLSSWGLKYVIPFFRLQAWCRLSRSALLERISSELEELLDQRTMNCINFLKQFDESCNRSQKFSLKMIEEFCQMPDALMEMDVSLVLKTNRLLRFDQLCAATTKKFKLFEPEFVWKDQTQRKKVLHRILARYRALPTIDQLPNVETQLSWEQFCDWYADRQQRITALEREFSDFVEDQREKEGRLFFRWCTAMLRANNEKYGIPTDKELAEEPAAPNTPGSIALKMTPSCIKAFIRYFANDVIGIQYAIPKECMEANLALTEALFYRRIHSYVLKYTSVSQRARDEQWRLQCQMCRFIDPFSYHVPENYYLQQQAPSSAAAAAGDGSTAAQSSHELDGDSAARSLEATSDVSVSVEMKVASSLGSSVAQSFPSHASSMTHDHSGAVEKASGAAAVDGDSTKSKRHAQELDSMLQQAILKGRQSLVESAAMKLQEEFSGEVVAGSEGNGTTEEAGKGNEEEEEEDDEEEAEIRRRKLEKLQRIRQKNREEDGEGGAEYRSFATMFDSSPMPPDQYFARSPPAASSGYRPRRGGEDEEYHTPPPPPSSIASAQERTKLHSIDRAGGRLYSGAASRENSNSGYISQTISAIMEEKIQERTRSRSNNVRSASGAQHSKDNGLLHSSQQREQFVKQLSDGAETNGGGDVASSGIQLHLDAKGHIVCSCDTCQALTISRRLQSLPQFRADQYGAAYSRSSRVMSFITTSITPREIIMNLSLAYKWLLRDAIDVSGSRSIIGADLLVPLFTLVVINAQIPNIHMVMQFLLEYGDYDDQGDVSYNIANLEGSVLFIQGMEIPQAVKDSFLASDVGISIQSSFSRAGKIYSKNAEDLRASTNAEVMPAEETLGSSPSNTATPITRNGSGKGRRSRSSEASNEDLEAMEQLGEWLRDQQTMEDTITILQKDGWMA